MLRAAALTLSLSLLAGVAHAQCLTASERATLAADIAAHQLDSTWSAARQYQHAFDRLGFGQNPNRADAYDPAAPDLRGALADRIALSVHQARAPRAWVGARLGALQDPSQSNPFVYRFADMTMNETYAETRNATLELQRIRALLESTTDTAERVRLQAMLRDAQRTRSRINRDIRNSAQAYRVAMMTSSANVAVGDVIAEFWMNHFNVDARKALWGSIDYQRALKSAQCGTFRQLLEASAKHPAMLIYLDNYRSRRGRINENYGRELLELHTLGDDTFRYYTQADVVDAARALTGWGIGFTEPSPGQHEAAFRFYAGSHVQGRITLFDEAPQGTPLVLEPINDRRGNPTAEAVARGEALLEYLANHPATRRNICTKLSRWLLGIAPGRIVQGCANDAVWGTDGDLAAIYSYLIRQPEMFHGRNPAGRRVANTFRNKEKNPVELVVSAYRAAARGVFSLDNLRGQIRASSDLGISPGWYPPPTGYPDERGWLSSGLLIRYNAFLHEAIDSAALRLLDPAGTNLQGNRLERYVQRRVDEALSNPNPTRNRMLDALSAELIAEVYKDPDSVNVGKRALRAALVNPDVRDDSGLPSPLRTHLHHYLGHTVSVRK